MEVATVIAHIPEMRNSRTRSLPLRPLGSRVAALLGGGCVLDEKAAPQALRTARANT